MGDQPLISDNQTERPKKEEEKDIETIHMHFFWAKFSTSLKTMKEHFNQIFNFKTLITFNSPIYCLFHISINISKKIKIKLTFV